MFPHLDIEARIGTYLVTYVDTHFLYCEWNLRKILNGFLLYQLKNI